MEQRGRGRARGRAREPQQQQQDRPGPGGQQGAPRRGGPSQRRGGQPGPQQQGGPLQGAWASRGPTPQGGAANWPRPQQSQPAQQVSSSQSQWGMRPPVPETSQVATGRGSRQAAPSVSSSHSDPVGGGDYSTPADSRVQSLTQGLSGMEISGTGTGRGDEAGGVRGRRVRTEIIHTKPDTCQSKKGSEGAAIALKSNYFALLNSGEWGLNHYRVDFIPDLDDTRERKMLMRQVDLGIRGLIFDGTGLYTPYKLHPDPLDKFVKNDRDETYNIRIRLVSEMQWGDHHYLQLFNLLLRKCFEAMKFKLLGRNYYDPEKREALREFQLELWPGFTTSMRQHEQKILLNVDLNFKISRTDTVYEMYLTAQKRERDASLQNFFRKLIGCVVLTYYNQKTYRIDDVDFKQTPHSTFQKKDGSSVSFKQYFEERYKLKIHYNDQPMLVSRSKPREIRAGMPEVVRLVPELCLMTGLNDEQRANFQLMKSLGEKTRIGPKQRIRKLLDFSQRLQQTPGAVEELKKWDIKLANDLIDLKGRVLPMEKLFFANHREVTGGPSADWSQAFRSTSMFCTQSLRKLAIICPNHLTRQTEEFARTLRFVGEGMNFSIVYKLFGVDEKRTQQYLDILEYVITDKQPEMVLVVLMRNSNEPYKSIKKKCYVDTVTPCQVVVSKNVIKNNKSVATKIAIQMNCKLGGSPWGSSMPANIMVVGYDVCRDTLNKGKSFAGMVATMDQNCSQYFSMAIEHSHEQELSASIGAFVDVACKQYRTKNGALPDRIVIYRDGVGDGQIPYVKSIEVESIKTKLQDLYKAAPVKMAFIIVSKRINTKFFKANGGSDKECNPPPGTVIDDVVTLPERYDFYLISQCVGQGTVAPTSYNIIEDTLGVDANKLQRFTYKLCHMYFNWSGTIRVPAPCQYAHKLAFMTAQYLHRAANPGLNMTLYYI